MARPQTPENFAHRLRTDYGCFYLAMNPRFEYTHYQQTIIAPALEEVCIGEIKRLMLFMPFRHAKSDLVTKNFVPFWFGHHPDTTVISLSYNHKLAHTFGRAVRDYMQSDLYRLLFPRSIVRKDSRAKDDFTTASGGHYYAAGFDGTINGLGAHLLIVDDPNKGPQDAMSDTVQSFQRELYASVINGRLEPDAAIIMVTTRWTPADLAGWRIREDGAVDYIRGGPFSDEPKREREAA